MYPNRNANCKNRLRTWAILQKYTLQDKLVAASHFLAQVAKDFFARAHGWRFSLRIDSH